MKKFVLNDLISNYVNGEREISVCKTEKLMKLKRMQVRASTDSVFGIVPSHLEHVKTLIAENGPEGLLPVMVVKNMSYSDVYDEGDYIFDRRHGTVAAHQRNIPELKVMYYDFEEDFGGDFMLLNAFALWLNRPDKPNLFSCSDDIKLRIRLALANAVDVDGDVFKAELQVISGLTRNSIAKLIKSVRDAHKRIVAGDSEKLDLAKKHQKHRTYSRTELEEMVQPYNKGSEVSAVFVEAKNFAKMIGHLLSDMRTSNKKYGKMFLYQGKIGEMTPEKAAKPARETLNYFGIGVNGANLKIEIICLPNTQPL